MNELEQQLKILEKEIDTINSIAARMDQITQTTKNWAVVTWAGSIALVLGKPDLKNYMPLTCILPIIFLFIDVQWRLLQRRSMFRVNKIRDFFNDGRLGKSIEEGRIVDFVVFDPAAKTYKENTEYKEYVSFKKVMKFPEIVWFYIPLSLLSVVFGLLLRIIG